MAVLFKSFLKIVIVKDFTKLFEEIYKIINNKSFFQNKYQFGFHCRWNTNGKFL